ncbi:MAG: MBL fold metallo-hydrolase [Beutenbergiaceae bacterium]
MRIVKREHACMVVTENGQSLLIDPGGWTAPLDDVETVVAVVVTHTHADHWTPDHLASLRQRFGQAPVFGPADLTQATEVDISVVASGSEQQVGPFRLRFYGGEHARIHASIPPIQNVGVMVNDRFAYGGDALVPPDGRPEVLAVPASAPWLKLGEVMDYLIDIRPEHTLAVHDALLSPVGLTLTNTLLAKAAESIGATHHRLTPGEHLEVG